MKLCRKLAALLAAVALAFGLSACQREEPQAEFDAKLYMDGMIRMTYLGEFSQEYLDMVGLTEDTARNAYESSLYLEARVFAYLYSIEYPDDLYEEIMELYRNIYTYFLDYEVVALTQYYDSDALAVQVDIAPIDIVQQVERQLDEVLKPFFEKYPSEVQNAMTTEEYKAVDAEWAHLIIDTYRRALYWAGNQEKQSVVIKLEKNEDGYYSISEDEFKKLDALVIDYSGPQTQPTPTPEPTGSAQPDESPDPSETPGENDPVPPTTASPLPEPEESEEPGESAPPEESPAGTE